VLKNFGFLAQEQGGKMKPTEEAHPKKKIGHSNKTKQTAAPNNNVLSKAALCRYPAGPRVRDWKNDV